ncbi:hypothetical protein, partial [Candidatus Ichthyocystis hellenicum]|uniref:hypothetical protein n=1 Tax=Candidatus Ichthyocystis hellenicum TaxID=1561003 RepID=UPI00111197FE
MSDKNILRDFPFSTRYSDSEGEDEQASDTADDSLPTPVLVSDSNVIGSDQEDEVAQASAIEGPSSPIPDSYEEEGGDVVSRLLNDYLSYLSDHPQPTSRMDFSSLLNLCGNYGYSTNMEGMSNFSDHNDFFQDYASSSGYTLTADFLSVINALRDMFVTHVRSVLLTNNFSEFLFKINASTKEGFSLLLGEVSRSFSRAVYEIRPSLVSHLRSEILPSILDAVNGLNILDENGDSAITSVDKERLFLYIITTFERYIILSMMDSWNNFCELNGDLLSSFGITDYRDPFVRATSAVPLVDIPAVFCPVAFTYRNGSYLSLFSVENLYQIIRDCSSDCIIRLKDMVTKRVTDMCADSSYISVKALSEHVDGKIDCIIDEEFRKVIISNWMEKIVTFFSELTIWSKLEVNADNFSIIFKEVINSVLTSVRENITNRSLFIRNAIKGCSKDAKTKNRKSCFSLLGQCKFQVNKEVYEKSMKVRAEHSLPFRKKTSEKFSELIKEKRVKDNKWSTQLLTIAVDESREILDDQYKALKRIISEAQVIESNGARRKIKHGEKVELHKSIMQTSNKALREAANRLWKNLVSAGGVYDSSTSVPSTEGGTADTSMEADTSVPSTEVGVAGTSVVATTSRS